MHPVTRVALGLTGLGAAAMTYAAGYEVRAFALRYVEVPCLPTGASPLRVLHLSDLHMMPRQGRKQRWLRDLSDLKPDLVVNTGDNIGHPDSTGAVLDSLGELLDRPGAFVFGSNDYWGPVAKSPLRYLQRSHAGDRLQGDPLPWDRLRDGFKAAGWLDLTNSAVELEAGGRRISLLGVDDPHLGRDELGDLPAGADPSVPRIGVTHAPYLRVLDAFTAHGCDLILAGHTHGGQVRVPGYGALVTNCDLDPRRARGLHHHQADGRSCWLHVSAGCGTSPYAPYRFACRPEASLVTLTAKR
ncbi:MAG TPA: metallophosphoesterase [Nocardioidaceae bacterium]|nr:metallophosphoesterase [Nocardioidaceae bacterium]